VVDIDHMGLLANMTRGRESAIHGLGGVLLGRSHKTDDGVQALFHFVPR
jgi:hypothetical protein